MRLVDKYRPSTFADVIGQDKIIDKLSAMQSRGLSGRAYFISGATGTGKTTIARIIASHVADRIATIEIDAGDCTIQFLRDVEQSWNQYGLGEKSGRAYIVNEAHFLRTASITKLLVMLDDIPQHVVFIFTTTKQGQLKLFDDQMDATALLGRCQDYELTTQGLNKVFAKYARDIATSENLNGQPIERYERLAKDCKNNLRKMLNSIDKGDMLV